jgi:hypothetical protein
MIYYLTRNLILSHPAIILAKYFLSFSINLVPFIGYILLQYQNLKIRSLIMYVKENPKNIKGTCVVN